MHSSGMGTVGLLTVSKHALWPAVYLPGGCTCLGSTLPGGVPARGVYLNGGYPAQGGVPAWGVPAWGGVPACEGTLPRMMYLPGGCTYLGGYLPRYSPPVDRQTDIRENITFANFV